MVFINIKHIQIHELHGVSGKRESSLNEDDDDQRWKWVSGSWVMGQMGHHFWMGHVCHGSVPVTN